jgi:hypothetical protein
MTAAVAEPGTDLVIEQERITAEIAALQAQEYGDDELLQTPILKVGQALTKEVQGGEAEAGEFINTLTNEGVGDTVEVILSYYAKGRFASDQKTNRAFVAFGSDIPDNWVDFVGEEFVGTPFSEYPEAEETYKARVNAKEIEWGKGPAVRTTHNFTGYLVHETEDDGTDYQPVRLSLKRTDVPAARKILTLLRAVLRNKPYWDGVLSLSTERKEFGRNASFIINPSAVKLVRKTTAEEKELGVQLAQAVTGGRTASVGAEAALEDRPAEPEAGGGLVV